MRTILKIFRDDVRGLVKNKFALLIAIAICILPSLYAWFNIYSNWDPYGTTSKIRVGVASVDKGYTGSDGETVVMGDEVMDQLRENDAICWVFDDTVDEAVDGVYSGDYYAAIVIGEDFSESMFNFAENGLVHPSVTYYENEKKNPIAIKITDTAKGTLQDSINEQFINTAVATVMESMNQLADDAKKTQYIKQLIEKLESVDQNLDNYLVTLDNLIACNETLASNLKTAGSEVSGASGKISSSASQVSQAKKETEQSVAVLQTQLDQVYDSIYAQMKEASDTLSQSAPTTEQVTQAAGDVSSTSQQIDTLKQLLQSDLIPSDSNKDDIITLLDSVQDTTNAVNNAIAGGSTDNAALAAASRLMVAVMPIIEKQLQSDINSMKASIDSAYNSMVASLNSLNDGLAGTGLAIDSLGDTISGSNSSFTVVQQLITSAKEDIASILSELNAVDEGDQYEQFIRILSTDPDVMGEFFASPVTVTTEEVYPVENYGSSVAPFYTVLALWVGIVILVALIKVQVEEERCPGARPYQRYFGRYLLFFVLGQLQAFVAAFGDLYLLDIQCLEPALFFFAASYTSFVFSLLIYTATVSFGDVGKAFVVVIMVIQIAGSSGTYPIEILPEFNQNVYIYFPFPYAIDAMRETIGGMYGNDYWVYLSQLSVFAVISLIVGLFVRKPFIKINSFVEKRMEDTKMM